MMVPEDRGRSLDNLQQLGDLSKFAQRQQRRPKREAQSIACSCVSRVFGRWSRALRACS